MKEGTLLEAAVKIGTRHRLVDQAAVWLTGVIQFADRSGARRRDQSSSD